MSIPINLAIADNHILVREGLISLITTVNRNFTIDIKAENGKDLIKKIISAVCYPDVCLIDVNMPEMNGYETTENIKKNFPSIKVIGISIYEEHYVVTKMLEKGADGFVSKSSGIEILNDAISAVYRGEKYVTPKIKKNIIRDEASLIRQKLSETEVQLLVLCCTENTYEMIGKKLHLSRRTVENYILKLCSKLNVESRIGLAMYAVRTGISHYSF